MDGIHVGIWKLSETLTMYMYVAHVVYMQSGEVYIHAIHIGIPTIRWYTTVAANVLTLQTCRRRRICRSVEPRTS